MDYKFIFIYPFQFCLRPIFFFIFTCISCIFHQYKCILFARNDLNCKFFWIFHTVRILCQICQRNNCTFLCQYRNILQRPVKFQHTSTVIFQSAKDIIPFTLRNPCFYTRCPSCFIRRLCNRTYNQLRSKIILIWHFICFRLLWFQVIHWTYQWLSVMRGMIIHRIKIWNHFMSKLQIAFHNIFRYCIITPRFLSGECTIRTVQTHNWREYTKLYPSGGQFFISVSFHVAADIMTPPPISHITCVRCKIWLKCQRFPANNRISGKSDWIPVTSHSRVSGKC